MNDIHRIKVHYEANPDEWRMAWEVTRDQVLHDLGYRADVTSIRRLRRIPRLRRRFTA